MYAWIVAAVALALVFTPPRHRKIAFMVVGVLGLVFLAIVLQYRRPPAAPPPAEPRPAPVSRKFDFDQYERDKKDREDPEAKTRIPPAETHFDQIQAIVGLDAGAIQSVHARLYNDSPRYTLTDFSYYLVIQDCLPPKLNDGNAQPCTTVYDQRDTLSLAVPPDQARDVTIALPRDPHSAALPFKLLGTPRIELTPTDVRSYQVKGSP